MGSFVTSNGVVYKIVNGEKLFITDLKKGKGLKKNAGNIVKNLNLISNLPINPERQAEFDRKHKPVNAGSYNMDDKRINK